MSIDPSLFTRDATDDAPPLHAAIAVYLVIVAVMGIVCLMI